MMFTEKGVVEDFIIQELQKLGWSHIPADKLIRASLDEPLLIENLREAIRRINRDLPLTSEDVENVINALRYKSPDPVGISQVLEYLRSGVPVKLKEDNTLHLVKIIDYENIDNNEFIVSNQIVYSIGDKEIRPDIVLYVNGIPLVLIECKNPVNPRVSWVDAYNQIKRYEKEFPYLFKYVQFCVAAVNNDSKYWASTPWADGDIVHVWREEDIEDSLEAIIKGMLSRNRLLDIIHSFIFVKNEHGKSYRVITRYMQYRATNKIVKRVVDYLTGKTNKNKGLIWHWQGSGKTLTMIFTSWKLQHLKLLENPTIFIVVDRKDLEEQLYQEFSAVGISAERISSIKHLIDVLSYDDYRGKRGIFLTLIQKFRDDEIKEFEKSAGRRLILSRRNIIVLVDEAHRSQYGSLATTLRSILPNAFYFAFTGTPIKKVGRDTYRVFSYSDEHYLDKYFIEDSIKDGFTLPICYQPRLPENIHLNKDDLEFFLKIELEEIPEEYREKIEDEVKRRLDHIKSFLKNPKRVDLVIRDIVKHFKEHVEPLGFKAMIVTVDREACVLYKRVLDKYLDQKYSEIVMTFTNTDPKTIYEYHEEFREKYGKRDDDEIRKEIIRRFKEEEYPKILIVTDMLLTGFDAPKLQVMYLDKPLKGHRLLQAIARTNRPYGSTKRFGLVIDYVGIFNDLRRALEMYESEDVKDVAYNIDVIKEQFKSLINEMSRMFKGIERKDDRETLMKALKILVRDEDGVRFEKMYKELKVFYELIAPDPFLRDYLDEIRWLSQVYYAYYRALKNRKPDELEEILSKKTSKILHLIYSSIDFGRLEKEFPIMPIDEKYLKELERLYPDLEIRVANLAFALRNALSIGKDHNPYYESLIERVERIVDEWRRHVKSTKEAYEKLKEIALEYVDSETSKRQYNLSDCEYAIFKTLNMYGFNEEKSIDLVRRLMEDLRRYLFPGWSLKESATKEIRMKVRLFLLREKGIRELPEKKRESLFNSIIDILKSYYQ